MTKKFAIILVVLPLTMIASRSLAMPIPSPTDGSTMIVRVADGCGPGRYRGPGGACHPFGRGPYPNGYYGPRPGYGFNGCPPGYWRGPWGHCRNTPYHGRLPGGGWQ